MNLMQNVRRIGLVGLILVAGNVSAFADLVNIISWNAQTASSPTAVATVSATSGAGNTAGTEISLTNAVLNGPIDGAGNAVTVAPIYLSFDLRSTNANTGNSGHLLQDFAGSFTIKDANGVVLVNGASITGEISQTTGRSTITLNTFFAADPTGTLITATNVQPYGYVAPFGVDINLGSASGLAATTINGVSTTTFTTAKLNAGDVQGTPGTAPSPVPEPSTFALLGLGAAAMAFGAYRRRAAV